MRLSIAILSFVLGIGLITSNLIGVRQSLRNPDIYDERIPDSFDIRLSEEELNSMLWNKGSSRKDFLIQLTKSVNSGIAHYWADEGIDKYNLRVPFTENYLLFLASYVYPEVFLKYEFTNHARAIERGVGLCSQHSMITSEVLREQGIPSNIVRLDGHVVLRAEASEESKMWWVLDPDYGVSIPHDITTIEEDPNLIRDYYSAAGFDENTINGLVGIYEQHGNSIVEGIGARFYTPKTWLIERLAYGGIWLFPIFLLLPLGYLLTRRFGHRIS